MDGDQEGRKPLDYVFSDMNYDQYKFKGKKLPYLLIFIHIFKVLYFQEKKDKE